MRISKPKENPPPKHLSERSAALWRALDAKYEFEPHDLERLRCVCEQVDLIDECEAAVKAGPFVKDRYGCLKAHPAIAVARDARTLLLRAIREMAIDVELPEVRVPRQGRRYG